MVPVPSPGPAFKIEVSGSLSVKPCLPAPVPGLRVLVRARVLPGQRLCGGYRNLMVAHGKEKVYGSIP
jgi:hypothetical protein